MHCYCNWKYFLFQTKNKPKTIQSILCNWAACLVTVNRIFWTKKLREMRFQLFLGGTTLKYCWQLSLSPTCLLGSWIHLLASSCFEKDFLVPRIKSFSDCTSYPLSKRPWVPMKTVGEENKSCHVNKKHKGSLKNLFMNYFVKAAHYSPFPNKWKVVCTRNNWLVLHC